MIDSSNSRPVPGYPGGPARDPQREMIRARIEALLSNGSVAAQVNRGLCSKGRGRSPWADPPAPAGGAAAAPTPGNRARRGAP